MSARWTALVPLANGGKTRLAPALSASDRARLAHAMLDRVLAAAHGAASIDRVVVLGAYALPNVDWLRDPGGGLNAALTHALAMLGDDIVIIHADLPFVSADDLDLLTAAAVPAGAFAVDRWGTGTTALALPSGRGTAMHFGHDSAAAFAAGLPGATACVRPGLGFDIDTPADLAEAEALGFVWHP